MDASNGKIRVLLIQDNARVSDALRAYLKHARGDAFTVEDARDLNAALARLQAEAFDAALLDLDLPGMQDLDGFIMLHLQYPSVPVLVFASECDDERGRAAVRAGAQTAICTNELLAPGIAREIEYAVERHALSHAAHSHAAQLQFSEARFRLLINENADGIVVVNEAGLIRFVNPAAEALFGKPRALLIGMTFPARVTPGETTTIEIARGAQTLTVQQHAVETLWNRENVYLVTLRDVTAERLTKQALKEASERDAHQSQLAQSLADSAAALNSTLRFEQVVDRLLENIGRVVPHDAASVFMIQGDEIRFVRGRGFEARGYTNSLQEWVFPLARFKHFLEMQSTRVPVVIGDTHNDPRWVNLEMSWIASYAAAPLCVRDTVIGFLNVDSETPGFYNEIHARDLKAFADQAATALDNARLHAEVEHRAQDLARVYDVMLEMGMQPEMAQMLETLVRRATELLRVNIGAVGLYFPEMQELHTEFVLEDQSAPWQAALKLGEGVVGRAALLREPVIVNDYGASAYRLEAFRNLDVGAVLCVPMLFGSELEGVLSVRTRKGEPRKFTPDDAQLLSLLATQAAALIHNVRQYQETKKRAQQLALVYDAGLTLNRVLEPRVQLDFLAQLAMRSVHADTATFWTYDQAHDTLVIKTMLGYSRAALDNKRFSVLPLASARGADVWAARERVPLLLNDAQKDERFVVVNPDLHSGIWVPIEHDNRLLGVLGVMSKTRNAFTPEDERLLVLFASQAAVALENTRMYQNILRENERRDILYWASQAVASAGLDAERVYAAIHQAVSRLMKCEAIVIALLSEDGAEIETPYLFDRQGRQPGGNMQRGEGLSGKVIDTGKPMLTGDLPAEGNEGLDFGIPEVVYSILGVPMRHGGQVVGSLLVESYDPNAYDESDRMGLEMLAAYAVAALLNVRNYERLRRALSQKSEIDQPAR